MKIHFEPVTEKNRKKVLALRVAKSQEGYVGIPIPPKAIVASRAGIYTLPQNTYWVLEPKHRKRAARGGLFIAPTGWLRGQMGSTPFTQ